MLEKLLASAVGRLNRKAPLAGRQRINVTHSHQVDGEKVNDTRRWAHMAEGL